MYNVLKYTSDEATARREILLFWGEFWTYLKSSSQGSSAREITLSTTFNVESAARLMRRKSGFT
jgi:hypothetical protein